MIIISFYLQTFLFMDETTLKGKRKAVYALLKMFKYIMDSKAKSYDAKYSVEMIFKIKEPSNIFGQALKEVLMYKNIQGLFNGNKVHPDLKELGVTESYSKKMWLTSEVPLATFVSP